MYSGAKKMASILCPYRLTPSEFATLTNTDHTVNRSNP
ncbi:hypothetical protein SAMN06265374_0109 [Roseibium denhamense]|uniref:Uncharacterized protein n=1 Tax=Roseibium denhamense TaxID=76305 RepID=A0ABY1PMU5_9HYPH|nr:hypothetical protein SAMN06265374_0109 [Roseibium denhamense]